MIPAILTTDLRFTPAHKTTQGRNVATLNALLSVCTFFRKQGFKRSGWLIDGSAPVSPSAIAPNPHKFSTGRKLSSGLVVLTHEEIVENAKYNLAEAIRLKDLKKVNSGKNANGVVLRKEGEQIVFNYIETKAGIDKSVEVRVNGVKKSLTYIKRKYGKIRTGGALQTA